MSAERQILACPNCRTRLSALASAQVIRCSGCGASFPKDDGSRIVVAGARPANSAAVTAGVFVLVGIGLLMSFQSVSLMSGSGIIWTGVALVGGGVALAFFLRAPLWTRIVAAVVLGLTLLNACSVESAMTDKRREISNILRD